MKIPFPAFRRLKTALLAPLIGALLLVCTSGVRAETDAATAEALMRSAGIWAQLDKIAPQVRDGLAAALKQDGTAVDPATLQTINRAADAAFGAEPLRNSVRRLVAYDLNPAHVAALQRWYGSASARTFSKLEEAASAPGVDPVQRLQQGAMLVATLPPARVAKLKEFVEVTRSAEALTNVTINMAAANNLGVALADPKVQNFDFEAVQEALEAQRPDMMAKFPPLALAIFAKTYEPVPDAELARFVAFLKTEAGMHFTDVSVRAMDMALEQATLAWGRSVMGTK